MLYFIPCCHCIPVIWKHKKDRTFKKKHLVEGEWHHTAQLRVQEKDGPWSAQIWASWTMHKYSLASAPVFFSASPWWPTASSWRGSMDNDLRLPSLHGSFALSLLRRFRNNRINWDLIWKRFWSYFALALSQTHQKLWHDRQRTFFELILICAHLLLILLCKNVLIFAREGGPQCFRAVASVLSRLLSPLSACWEMAAPDL